jgi:antitoxin VapB
MWAHGIYYGIDHREVAMDIAKLFKNGRSQAVRLPKQYAFSGDEVYVTKVNGVVMLVPKGKGAWKPLLDSLGMFSEDFLKESRIQRSLEKRESLQ